MSYFVPAQRELNHHHTNGPRTDFQAAIDPPPNKLDRLQLDQNI